MLNNNPAKLLANNGVYGVTGKPPYQDLCSELSLEYIRVSCDGPHKGYTLYFRKKDGSDVFIRMVFIDEIIGYAPPTIEARIEKEVREYFKQYE